MNLPDSEAMENNTEQENVIGSSVEITFTSLGNNKLEAKVDTGATNSCLNAQNIKVNQRNGSVSFVCPELSGNVITMEMVGSQDVVTADGLEGGSTRPVVKFDIEINGIPFNQVSFNLNDRSGMDSPVLVGQNILKLGNFLIDVNKDEAPERAEAVQRDVHTNKDRTHEVSEAIQTLAKHNVTLLEIVRYMNQVN